MSSPQMNVVAAYLRLTRERRTAPDPVAASKEPPRPPAKLVQRHDVRSRSIDGFECCTVSPRGRRAERAVVYLHGGAYISHMLPQHWQLISQLADAGVRVEVAQYGLAPKYTYRDAYPFVTAVYRDLLSDLDAGQVTIMGDSAGAGLALGVAQSLVGSGLPQPARVLLISPWLDLTLTNPAIPEVEARDPFLTTSRLLAAGRGWAGGDDPAHPRLSPVNGPLAPLAPIDVYIGTRDLFYPDVRRLEERAAAEGAAVNVIVCDGAVHAYPLVPAPEGRAAARAIVRSAAS
ncbi:steryl acetyl hydrolase [Streptomyces cyaneochromogenes]|uniref:Steryl acetyl hydrolase n=1 Tax=Streptomyces cyaneochromogenes TaxID=2496836 RepID=A0A3Q9EVD7_9ACTN|nr:alpha/beta hydrolase fold domain-containing protein [Streptomyces cyaneochromogenes]AZQ37131.1 steryl acetyl hydrolase [Streptomyces cyaneochromogenes]